MRNNITVRKAESIDGDGAYGDRQNKTWGTVTETFEEIILQSSLLPVYEPREGETHTYRLVEPSLLRDPTLDNAKHDTAPDSRRIDTCSLCHALGPLLGFGLDILFLPSSTPTLGQRRFGVPTFLGLE